MRLPFLFPGDPDLDQEKKAHSNFRLSSLLLQQRSRLLRRPGPDGALPLLVNDALFDGSRRPRSSSSSGNFR